MDLAKVGHSISYPQLYRLARGDLGRKWDSHLIALALVYSCAHPCELLGLPAPHPSWYQPVTPWPGPLAWAASGVPVKSIADALGVPTSRVHSWLKGALPPIEDIPRLATALRVEPQQLIPIKRRDCDITAARYQYA